MANPLETGPALSGERHDMAPQPRTVEAARMEGVRKPVTSVVLPQRVMNTLTTPFYQTLILP